MTLTLVVFTQMPAIGVFARFRLPKGLHFSHGWYRDKKPGGDAKPSMPARFVTGHGWNANFRVYDVLNASKSPLASFRTSMDIVWIFLSSRVSHKAFQVFTSLYAASILSGPPGALFGS